jgi:hypothetical protein
MDPRSRVRQFLARGTADRPPFLAMATEYTAHLAQCTTGDLLADPGLFARSFTESVAVLGLEALLIEFPAPAAVADPAGRVPPVAMGGDPADRVRPVAMGGDPADRVRPVAMGGDPADRVLHAVAGGDPAASGLAVLREGLHRVRAALRDRLALAVLLPGPLTLAASLGLPATPDTLDDLVTALITLQEYLAPADLDALALLEREAVADPDVPILADATAAFWNVARYYSLPSLLIAARATPRLAETGPTAVAAWVGVTAADLLAAGATAAGQPPPAGHPEPAGQSSLAGQPPPPTSVVLPPLPPGGFYLSAGEIPAGWSVATVRSLLSPLSG